MYRRPAIVVELDDQDRAFLLSLALQQADQLDAVVARMLPAAQRNIATFRNAKEWPSHAVSLNLTVRGSGGSGHAATIEGLANGVGTPEALKYRRAARYRQDDDASATGRNAGGGKPARRSRGGWKKIGASL